MWTGQCALSTASLITSAWLNGHGGLFVEAFERVEQVRGVISRSLRLVSVSMIIASHLPMFA